MAVHERFAVAHGTDIETVRAYLPDNYKATAGDPRHGGNPTTVLIYGHDVAGWTLDDYVIPRLASGLIFAEEC